MTEELFKEAKDELLKKAKENSACVDQYRRALSAENPESLLKVVYDNLQWCSEHKIVNEEYLKKFPADIVFASGCANTGKENTGLANSGDSNSGYRNSGDRNSGDSNSGDRNSGDSNSGYRNSGYRNSGDSNSGSWNSGDSNSGYRNSGSWNSGDSNSGDRNSGDSNSGDRNSGDSNSGSWNSGDSNSGDSNSGSWNSGDRNSGDSNSGSWNSGDRNSGDSNSGYRNSGAFCTEKNPKMLIFDEPADMTVREWEESKAVRLMNSIDPTIWVPSDMMSDQEKADHPKHETTDGYLKSIPIKEAWQNAWGNWDEPTRAVFTSLPNFNADKFETITGIRV